MASINIDVKGFSYNEEAQMVYVHGTAENSNEAHLVRFSKDAFNDLVKFMKEHSQAEVKETKKGAKQ